MNYGYSPTPKDRELALGIQAFIMSLPPDEQGRRAYVELNGLYSGVRVRRLTHYPDDQLRNIVRGCDAIHERFLGLEHKED
ncbi:MAG: hypothetical protein KKB13_21275 [Chloroflexi bacterium]|nr:hypothetical protein [Chloroflexota bacterium]